MPVSLLSLLTAIAAFFNDVGASETAFDLSKVMASAVESVKGDILMVLALVIPAAIVITGAVVGFTFGRKWLKKLAN